MAEMSFSLIISSLLMAYSAMINKNFFKGHSASEADYCNRNKLVQSFS